MNNKIIKSLDMIIEGLTTLKSELENNQVAPVNTNEEPVAEEVKEEPVASKEDSAEVDLENMKYSELKKYASERGIKNVGTREEIIARIKKEESKVVQMPTKEAEEENPVEEAMNPPEEDEFAELAKSIAEETDIEDIISALADVNIKATKKNAIAKLEDALRKGLIELDDEDEDEDAEDAEDESSETEEPTDDDAEVQYYNPTFDPEGYNDPETMSEDRRSACEALVDDILAQVSEGKLTLDELKDFVETICTEDELDLVEDAEDEMQILYLYMEVKKRFIDNEGNLNAPNEPYEIGEDNFCCGHELKYDKKSHMYICEVCGQEYEAE